MNSQKNKVSHIVEGNIPLVLRAPRVDNGVDVGVVATSTSFELTEEIDRWQRLSHTISEEKPSASHMCARIRLHTYDRKTSEISLTIFKAYHRV
jgi:hypothetical protein